MDINYSLDLSGISKELTFILEIMGMKKDDGYELLKNEWFADINWELFLQLAKHHRVYPFLYSKVKNLDGIPPHVVQTLNQEYKKNTFQMLTLCGEMERVSKLFADNQIPLLFLKGPVVAADLYGDISLRTSKDLDILISVNRVEKAEKLFMSLGYEKESVQTVLNDWKWRVQHIVYFHPQKQIMLEIHWRLEPFPSKEPAFYELWERRRVSPITKYPVYFLGEEDLFVYLVSHGARHGWFRLRWLLDIDQMVRKGFNLEKVKLLLYKYRRLHIAGQALILAWKLFKTPIQSNLEVLTKRNDSKRLAQHAIEFINRMDSLAITISTKSYRRYSCSLKKSQKFLKMLILLYPSYSDVQTLKLPKSLHFLYFPLRPFLWATRKIKRLSLRHGDL